MGSGGIEEGATLARWFRGAVLWGFLLRQRCGRETWRRRQSGSILPAQVAAYCLPRWQTGRDWTWTGARDEWSRAPLPAARALPLPLNQPAVREPRARRAVQAQAPRPGGCRSGSPPPAAAPHRAPAAAPRAMDLHRGLLMAWALSLWPGTCSSCFPLPPGTLPGPPGPLIQLPGAGRARCASQGPILATLWGRGSPRNWLQSSGPAKFRKSGRRVESTWSGEFGVFWEELKRLELKSAAGWPHRTPHWTRWTPRATPGFPRHHQGHSGVSGAPRARAGKGMGRAERALPRCPNARRGGRILQCGEPGTEALEGWGDLGAESSPESVPPRTKRTLARQPQGGGEQSPARPKAAGRNSAVQRSRKRYLTLGVGTEH